MNVKASSRAHRVLSMRLPDETWEMIKDFQAGQLATPSQTEAVKALVQLGFEAWEKLQRRTP